MADSPWEMLSAIGTLGAVIVALGVSGQSIRANWKAEKDRAELAAAKMLSPLSALERKASYIFVWFSFTAVEPTKPDTNILEALEELEALAKAISIEDLYPLLKLRSHAAKRSARALGLIQAFVSDVQAMFTHPFWMDLENDQIATSYRRWLGMLSEIKEHLIVAVMVCESAASTGAPRPSSDEIHSQ